MTGSFIDWLLERYEREFVEMVCTGAYSHRDGMTIFPVLDSYPDGRLAMVHLFYGVWMHLTAESRMQQLTEAVERLREVSRTATASMVGAAALIEQMEAIEWENEPETQRKPTPKRRLEPQRQPWRKQHR